MNYLSSFLIALGAAIALFGAAFDFIVPGASPGVNLPQMLIIAAGLALAAAAWRLRSARPRRRIRASKARAIAISLLLSLVTLFVLEIVLTVGGIPTYFPSEIPDRSVIVSDSRTCDDLGCRPGVQATRRGCADGTITGRQCIVNQQSFADSEDFVVKDDFDERTRIILMGDSFVQGYSADIGKSFAAHLEAEYPEFIIWNTAISGNGTRQAEAAFRAFAPQLRPQLAILGFYMNDFRDNLLPHDDRLLLQDSAGVSYVVRRFQIDRWGNPVQLPADLVNAYLAAGYIPPVSELERAIGLTRLGTLALRIMDVLGAGSIDESMENQLRLTRDYLTRLRDSASAQDTTLLVLLVPRRADIDEFSELYLTAIAVMEDLEIPYLDPRQFLDTVNDYKPSDIHWNNSGHFKIGAVLVECIQSFIASGDMGNCDHVVVPAQESAI